MLYMGRTVKTKSPPNTIESVRPLSGSYSFRKDFMMNGWFIVVVVSCLAGLIVTSRIPSL
jgi:hypothetical protein